MATALDSSSALALSMAPLSCNASARGAEPWTSSAVLPLRLESTRQLSAAAYRLPLWPSIPTEEWALALPFYLNTPSSDRKNSGEAAQEQEQEADGSFPAGSQAALTLGGTFAMALLLYTLLPYARLKVTRRQRRLSSTLHKPKAPATTRRRRCRYGRQQDHESSGGVTMRQNGQQERRNRPAEAAGRTSADAELLVTTLPELQDDRGWRDFFDSQIYRKDLQRPRETDGELQDSSDDQSIARKRRDRQVAATSSTKADFQVMKEQIDRAAMEAAIEDLQSFFESWQM